MTRRSFGSDRLRELLSYAPETGVFTWLVDRGPIKAGRRAGCASSDGYRRIQVNGQEYQEHILVWLYMTGQWPHLEVDHKNLVKSDNRFCNLRLATKSQQQANTRLLARNKHGGKGLKWRSDRRKWRVDIQVNGVSKTVGHFKDKQAAINAYENAAKTYFGEFARAS